MENAELMHYGVKGMKWGVRRKRRDYLGPSGGVKGGPYRQEGTPAGAKGGPSKQKPVGTVKGGPLTDKQIKKYAKKGYAQDSFRSNKTVAGKAWDAYTGAHKTQASIKYDMSSKKQNQERAEKYLADKKQAKKSPTKKKIAKAAAKGAKATAGCLAKVGQAYVTDQLFFGGYGTAAAKEAIRGVGMATITAYTMARGGYDIKWYDKQGRRVG